MHRQLESGDIVTIYQDPITQKRYEGTAKLIERIHVYNHGTRWLVRFEGEDQMTERMICPEKE